MCTREITVLFTLIATWWRKRNHLKTRARVSFLYILLGKFEVDIEIY